MNGFATAWLVAGLVLMATEVVVPGFVVIFFGAAAVLVAGVAWTGLIESWAAAGTLWMLASVGMVVTLRGTVKRLAPGETDRASTDEDAEALGQVVEVVEEVGPFESGRIRFRGVNWDAQSVRAPIPAGRKARIIARDNLIWIVDSIEALPGPGGPKEDS